MKPSVKLLTLLLVAAMLTGCGQQQKPNEKYCGVEISGFEVIDLKKIGDRGYDYSEEDKSLLADVTTGVNALFNNEQEIEVFFFMKDAESIGMYIITPDDKAMVEKISCFILSNDFAGRMPKIRKLLFYTNEHNTLVAAIKTKEDNNG